MRNRMKRMVLAGAAVMVMMMSFAVPAMAMGNTGGVADANANGGMVEI